VEITPPWHRDHHPSALGVTERACQDLGTERACQDLGSFVMLAQETSGNGARCQP
jgi:hypothetical protein